MQKESFITHFRDEHDERTVMISFPKGTLTAVILHKRFMINNKVVDPDHPNNYCIECTFLLPGGEEDPRFSRVLFRVGDVAAYVTKSKSNVVVSLLLGSLNLYGGTKGGNGKCHLFIK